MNGKGNTLLKCKYPEELLEQFPGILQKHCTPALRNKLRLVYSTES